MSSLVNALITYFLKTVLLKFSDNVKASDWEDARQGIGLYEILTAILP